MAEHLNRFGIVGWTVQAKNLAVESSSMAETASARARWGPSDRVWKQSNMLSDPLVAARNDLVLPHHLYKRIKFFLLGESSRGQGPPIGKGF